MGNKLMGDIFYQIPVRNFKLKTHGSGCACLKVFLNKKIYREKVLNYEKLLSYRKQTNLNYVFWVSGGGAYIINNEWIPLVQRSKDSLHNPGKITISTGRANNYRELLRPQLLIRELFEEIILINKNTRKVLVPVFGGKYKLLDCCSRINIKKLLTRLFKKNKIKASGFSEIPASFISGMHLDCAEVYKENKLQTSVGSLLHINKDTRDVNLLFGIALDLSSGELEDLVFVDTETVCRDGEERPLKRKIILYNIQNKKYYELQNGSFAKRRVIHPVCTEHAKYFLKKARILLN